MSLFCNGFAHSMNVLLRDSDFVITITVNLIIPAANPQLPQFYLVKSYLASAEARMARFRNEIISAALVMVAAYFMDFIMALLLTRLVLMA